MAHSVSSWLRGKCIGKGSFGSVYCAVSTSDNTRVFAVKSVDGSNCLAPQLESIENEIKILKSISSPYVVKYLGDDVTRESASTWHRNLHLEYLPGGTVADVFDIFGGKCGDVEVLRSHARCILSALSYLHANGIAHCDIKGKNVLVGHVTGTCKLADFGSAIELPGDHRENFPIVPRGSPLWMAPEVVRREYQGPESDVWSLGCTVIEMITGNSPWNDGGDVVETLRKIGFSDELPEFPTQLSELGRDFVSKCLRRDPSERWSCDQLLQHPFVSRFATDTVTESSPRCVLDWIDTEFSDEEETEHFSNNLISSIEISARRRISELASNSGAIWESDGWIVTRDWGCEGDNSENEGTSSIYLELTRGKIGIEETIIYTKSTIWEYSKRLNGIMDLVVAAGSSYWNGFEKIGSLVDIQNIYSWCKMLLLFLLFHLQILIFIFQFAKLFTSLRSNLARK